MDFKYWFRTIRSKLLPNDGTAIHAASPGQFAIGTQMAQASAAQHRHDEATGHRPSLLAGLRYSSLESRLWRWTEAPVDKSIEAHVANYLGSPDEPRKALRDALAMDDFYTLLTFVRRRALAALRNGEVRQIEAAFSALAMIELARVDWRDFLVASRLARYAAQRLDAPVADLVNRVAQLAEPQVAQLLKDDLKTRVDLAEACGFREVCTNEGLALFDTSYERFSPDADLAEIGFNCALSLEKEGYEIRSIEVATEIPLVWLKSSKGSAVAKMLRKVSGCATIHGVPRADPAPRSSGQSVLVFLAEAASDSDAREIVASADKASSSTETQFGQAAGRLFAVIIQWSWMTDTPPLEDMQSLERLRIVFRRLLAQK